MEQLLISRGTVEPVIINHDPEKWATFMRVSGRDVAVAALLGKDGTKTRGLHSTTNGFFDPSKSAGTGSKSEVKNIPVRLKVCDLSDSEKYRFALSYASRLGHVNMEAIFRNRLGIKNKEEL